MKAHGIHNIGRKIRVTFWMDLSGRSTAGDHVRTLRNGDILEIMASRLDSYVCTDGIVISFSAFYDGRCKMVQENLQNAKELALALNREELEDLSVFIDTRLK